MKLTICLLGLGPALAMFLVSSVFGMEMALEERLLDASTSTAPLGIENQTTRQHENMAESGQSIPERIVLAFKGLFNSEKETPPINPVTIGSMAVKFSHPFHTFYHWPIPDKDMREFARKATAIISDPALYSEKPMAWKDIIQEGLSLWGAKQNNDVDGFRVLGLLKVLHELAPANMEAAQSLIDKFPDELKLKLNAVEEYPGYFADRLYRAYTREKKEPPSDIKECWARSTVIGEKQRIMKEKAPDKSMTKIDEIVKKYLLSAKLPQVEEDIEKMISEMCLNLKEVCLDDWEGKYSMAILEHLLKHPSAVQTKLFELERQDKFLADVIQRFHQGM